jgi:O-antigen ligase
LFFGGGGGVAQAMGRQSNYSGRTDIWAALIEAAPNGIGGAGFESFWISPNVVKFQHALEAKDWWHPESLNEAHNGYLEVYLNLGLVGVGIILWILISGCRRAVAAFQQNPSLGGLMLAYIIASAFYSVMEAGFRMISLMWIFLLLSSVCSRGIAAGIFGSETPKISARITARRG